jgi:triosephosphate isomerase
MSKPLIIANWKMNLLPDEAADLAVNLKKKISAAVTKDLEIILCPSFEALYQVGQSIAGGALSLGAQDVFWQQHGAFTGEVSAQSLKQLGCQFVIAGTNTRN